MEETKCRMSEHGRGPCVIITVDKGKLHQRVYSVHRSLLEKECGLFRELLSPAGQINTSQNDVSFPDVSAPTFDTFVDWLYEGIINIDRDKRYDATHLTAVYVLATKLICSDLKNRVMEEVLLSCRIHVSIGDLVLLNHAGLSNSRLAQYFLRHIAYSFAQFDPLLGYTWQEEWQELKKCPAVLLKILDTVRLAAIPEANRPGGEEDLEWYFRDEAKDEAYIS